MELKLLKSTQIELLQQLAREIWEEHYLPIIGQAQIDYMLGKFYSTRQIQSELTAGVHWEILWDKDEAIGYLVCEIEESKVHLSKLYLKQKSRGKGLGKLLIDRTIELTQIHQKNLIYLNVNKNNIHSIAFYERMGFYKAREGVFDIGNGFVMDDFIYELEV